LGSALNVTSKECSICPKGTYANSQFSTSCTLCPIGTYSDQEEANECLPCGVFSTSASIGSTSCDFNSCAKFRFNTNYSKSFYVLSDFWSFDQNFADAKLSCYLLNDTFGSPGNLAVVKDSKIGGMLQDLFADFTSNNHAWIGLEQLNTTLEPSDGWFWADGTPAAYFSTQWNLGEPSGVGEECSDFYLNGDDLAQLLNDSPCSDAYPFICEIPGMAFHLQPVCFIITFHFHRSIVVDEV
jgi:hypothetical protein